MPSGLRFPDFGKDDFPLAGWAEHELENGRGFLLARGLPVDRYSDEEIEIAYYGIGLHLGQKMLGVMNVGDPNLVCKEIIPYHSDLLCVRKAKQGGESSLVSIAALYNRLLRADLGLIDQSRLEPSFDLVTIVEFCMINWPAAICANI